MNYKVEVKQEDIDNAGRMGCDCPIAMAIGRQLNVDKTKPVKFWVRGTVICDYRSMSQGLSASSGRKQIDLPPKAQLFIRIFDDFGRHSVEPFTFYIDRNPKELWESGGTKKLWESE